MCPTTLRVIHRVAEMYHEIKQPNSPSLTLLDLHMQRECNSSPPKMISQSSQSHFLDEGYEIEKAHVENGRVELWKQSCWAKKATDVHSAILVYQIHRADKRNRELIDTALSLHHPWHACWVALICSSMITDVHNMINCLQLVEIPSESPVRETKATLRGEKLFAQCLEHFLNGNTFNSAENWNEVWTHGDTIWRQLSTCFDFPFLLNIVHMK